MPTCIICWKTADVLSDEHVIPEGLGGHYHITSVCRDCNSRLGHHIDSKLVNHTFSKFGRYLENLTGKSKNLPNPFSGTHTLADDESQKMRLEIDETGALKPHLIPKVEWKFDQSTQNLTLILAMPPADKEKILEKVERRYGIKTDSQALPVTKKQVTVRTAITVDTLEFKIGLLKMAYEFAYDVLPRYRLDPTVKEISAILENVEYENAEKYANIGDGFDRSVLKQLSEIIDFQTGNHYLVLLPSNQGLICFVHLYNMFCLGVTLSTAAYPVDMIVGVNDFKAKKFTVHNAAQIGNIVFGSPVIRLQHLFKSKQECAAFLTMQSDDRFKISGEDGDYPLYDKNGNRLEQTMLGKVAELAPVDVLEIDSRILDVEMDEELYVRILPFNAYVQVSAVRLEYTPRAKL